MQPMMVSNHLILCCPLLLLSSIIPSIRVFPKSRLFTSGGQSTGASASASVLPMNIQGRFPLGLTALISLLSKGLSRIFSSTSSKASILWLSAFFMFQLSHPYIHNYWEKNKQTNIVLTRQTFAGKVMSLLFNKLSRLVITFLPKSNCLLIS